MTPRRGLRILRAEAAILAAVLTLAALDASRADEGGASLYLPGSFASMAAVPGVPGWSTAWTYYHAKASIGGATEKMDVAYGNINYAFETAVLGGQLSLSLVGAFGKMSVDIADVGDDSRNGLMDVTPAASLRWSEGVNNYLLYTLTNVPVGTYNKARLANFGIGHWGQDAGAGYTYFDKDTGYEFSAVAGVTYNFENPHTQYKNGIDAHLDFAASRFFPNQVQLGVAGYFYQQVTGDSGKGATLGDYRGSVIAIGPQAGYLFPIGDQQGYFNVRAYREFAAENRPAGWNLWMTVAISPKGP